MQASERNVSGGGILSRSPFYVPCGFTVRGSSTPVCNIAPFTVNIIHTSVSHESFDGGWRLDSLFAIVKKRFELQRRRLLFTNWRGFLWTGDTFGSLIGVARRVAQLDGSVGLADPINFGQWRPKLTRNKDADALSHEPRGHRMSRRRGQHRADVTTTNGRFFVIATIVHLDTCRALLRRLLKASPAFAAAATLRRTTKTPKGMFTFGRCPLLDVRHVL